MAERKLTGPSLMPKDGPPTHLVVMVHGYGADGQDLIGLAGHWRAFLPRAAFAAPNGPEPVPGGPGYQWFPISRIDPHEMRRGVEGAAPVLEAFMDAELARLHLSPDRLALVGFSQGTMLSLHLGLHRRVTPAAIVGFSGLLAGPVPDGPPPATPFFLTHGDADTVIPPQAMFQAAGALGRAGATVQWHLAPGMGHGIDGPGLMMAGQFLGLALGGHLAGTGTVSCPFDGSPGGLPGKSPR